MARLLDLEGDLRTRLFSRDLTLLMGSVGLMDAMESVNSTNSH